MRNLKLNLLIAWDWVQENVWFFLMALTASLGLTSLIHELLPYYIAATMIAAAIVSYILYIVRILIIRRKIKKLSAKALKEWKQREAFLDNRSQRLKLDYLNGKPVTIIDNSGTVWRFQSGTTDTIISTAN